MTGRTGDPGRFVGDRGERLGRRDMEDLGSGKKGVVPKYFTLFVRLR
jgi:hypothetical protein